MRLKAAAYSLFQWESAFESLPSQGEVFPLERLQGEVSRVLPGGTGILGHRIQTKWVPVEMNEPEEHIRLSETPAMMILQSARLLTRLADSRFRDLQISASQVPVLVALKNGEKLSQKELTRLAGVEQSSMAQLLSRMERDGLILREADTRDRRSTLIRLSPKALECILPGRKILFQGNDDALQGFSAEETGQLVSLLSRVLENLKK